ncbi:helix-turn-helix domain-containing protein [Rhizobium giardinii]|uniref:helix-turn-helix domain-containing protein n=1 Tax=Rhizobium giardinii TaxID=56731 RepID=UPI0009FDD656
MPDMSLDLRYLRYAMIAAEYGSFRRVAQVIGVSQSTVSRAAPFRRSSVALPGCCQPSAR